MISLPLVGNVRASGKSVEGLRAAISSALAPNFASAPTVFLSVGQLNPVTTAVTGALAQQAAANVRPYGTVTIYAMGEFNTQGAKNIKSGTTLLQFLAEAGGLSRFAATKRIQLHRPDKKTGSETVYKFDYKAVQAGARAPVIVLRDGDVIVAPERKLFE